MALGVVIPQTLTATMPWIAPFGGGMEIHYDGLCDMEAQFAEEAGAIAMREVFVPRVLPSA